MTGLDLPHSLSVESQQCMEFRLPRELSTLARLRSNLKPRLCWCWCWCRHWLCPARVHTVGAGWPLVRGLQGWDTDRARPPRPPAAGCTQGLSPIGGPWNWHGLDPADQVYLSVAVAAATAAAASRASSRSSCSSLQQQREEGQHPIPVAHFPCQHGLNHNHHINFFMWTAQSAHIWNLLYFQ